MDSQDPPRRRSHQGAGVAATAAEISHQYTGRAALSAPAGAGASGKHMHGASCGHLAVLHDQHVDFLNPGGQLECYHGKEVCALCVRRVCVYISVRFFLIHNCATG